ncbi:MAG TPA: MBL fold metallo-hydrolase [Bacillales bacterium]|nr:MBL fold metallo-hydrolase [Bacillales bacterium]
MTYERIGPIEIVTGENNSHVPFSTSLLIHGKDEDALIDCGGGETAFRYLQQQNIQALFMTHYHIDHVWGAYLFPNARKAINEIDVKKINDPIELAKAGGRFALLGEDGAKKEIEQQLKKSDDGTLKPRWAQVIGLTQDSYAYEKEIEAAGTKMIMLHTPGHTEGYCTPYFPEHGVLFVGDFDLTSFGPWYNDADSDIDAFFKSAERTLDVDAETFVTAHHKGTYSRQAYRERLHTYMNKIREREEKTKIAVQNGVHPKDIVYEEIFYFRKNHRATPRLLGSEIIGIAKHLEHLIKAGLPFKDYFHEFCAYHGLHAEWLNYKKADAKSR